MSLMNCAECGLQVSTEAKACPHCGAVVPKPSKPKLWLWIPLGLVVAFLGFGMVVANTPEGKVRTAEREAIERCWDEQKRLSLAPEQQRFIAGACERMEREYTAKHGRTP